MPLAHSLGHPLRLTLRALLVVAALGLLVFTGHAALDLNWGLPDGFYDAGLYNLVQVVTTVLVLIRAALVPGDRLAWLALGIGLGLYNAGDIYYSAALSELEEVPYPSWADAAYLGFYPPTYAALALLIRTGVRGVPASMCLDGMVAVLGVAALASAFVLPAIIAAGTGSTAAVATSLAYPLLDLLLLAVIAAMFAATGWRPGRAWALLGAGLALQAVADGIYLYEAALETYEEGTYLDALWPAGTLALAVAAWQPGRRRVESPLGGWVVLVVPGTLALAALGLLVFDHFAQVNTPALLLAAATLVAAGVRTALTFREVRQLADSRRLAVTDELTELTNRRGFLGRLDPLLEASRRGAAPTSLLVIDLDRFKELNDTLGHVAGDALLREVARRLEVSLPEADTLARLGGDEFAVLLTEPSEAGVAAANRLRVALEPPFRIQDLSLHVQASVGVATAPEHGLDPETLLRRADLAMYEAKRTRTGVARYALGRDETSRLQIALVGELRLAIDSDQLLLHYQPKVDLGTGAVVGVEALVRWLHPARGLVNPVDFIPLAEQTDLIRPLTLHVLDRAVEQGARWLAAGRELEVAVNVAVSSLLDLRFPGEVAEVLARHALPPDRLTLEITESAVMADSVRGLDVLARLCDLGVGLSLDDFGTGHSSLAHLKLMPVQELKIDRCFVTTMIGDATDMAIVRATLELARHLELRVVGEGVEDAETGRELARFGCDMAQGFGLSRPLPAGELDEWLDARARPGDPPGPVPELEAVS